MIAKTRGDNIGVMQKRPNRGKLPVDIPEPHFVADPNHWKKCFTGDVWKLHQKPVEKRLTITKMDINRLGTGFRYMIWSLSKKPRSEWLLMLLLLNTILTTTHTVDLGALGSDKL
jgi:hypothetical protein